MVLKSGNFWLFMILGLNFWLVPIFELDEADEQFTDGLMAATLLAAVAIQGMAAPRFRKWAILAGIVILAAIAAEEILANLKYVENAVFAISFAAATALYFHTMTENLEEVTFDTVLAAACTYLLIGMFFAAIFGLVIEFDPNAFAAEGSVTGRYDMLYFSFATLTTLGAVDIIPSSDLAKMLTVFEAIVGLIYIAILVGAVVGSYAAKMSGRRH